ncbi:envelope glycoprotein C [Spheniscid alphaherpesvirus 1]|uniref:Envelope glycoprotein C n=1 Tax=Spheniscid alphaherpesvirus 1 TaxID=2560777 RepID=A0A1R3TE70_9ALPH|nr:envelope glycoprotein C [Spheniscid alphaherpesvirus 1]
MERSFFNLQRTVVLLAYLTLFVNEAVTQSTIVSTSTSSTTTIVSTNNGRTKTTVTHAAKHDDRVSMSFAEYNKNYTMRCIIPKVNDSTISGSENLTVSVYFHKGFAEYGIDAVNVDSGDENIGSDDDLNSTNIIHEPATDNADYLVTKVFAASYTTNYTVDVNINNPHKYSVEVMPNSDVLLLTIRSITTGDEGVYMWEFSNGNVTLHRSFVKLEVYKVPSKVEVTAPPRLLGNPFDAICFITNFYPQKSVKVYWFKNSEEVNHDLYETVYETGFNGLTSVISTLTVMETKNRPPPALKCVASITLGNADKVIEHGSEVVPAVYFEPTVTAYVNGYGKVVCKAKCVLPNTIGITWTVGGVIEKELWPAAGVTESGVCEEHPGLVNIVGQRDLSEENGPIEYKCHLIGYPHGLPDFTASVIFDASPELMAKPVIVTAALALFAASVLGSLIMITALCLYYSRDTYGL